MAQIEKYSELRDCYLSDLTETKTLLPQFPESSPHWWHLRSETFYARPRRKLRRKPPFIIKRKKVNKTIQFIKTLKRAYRATKEKVTEI